MSEEVRDFVSAFGEEIGSIVKENLSGVKSGLNRLEAKQATIKGLMQLVERDMSNFESAICTLEKKAIDYAEVAKEIDFHKIQIPKQIGQISSDIDDDLESRFLASRKEVDDLLTRYMDLLKSSKRQHTDFAHLLSHLDTNSSSLRSLSQLEIPHRVGAKKAKKGADEPIIPSASASARVESPSSLSY